MTTEFRKEIWRKSVHLSGILFLPILFWKRDLFVLLLALFLAGYLITEGLDRKGRKIPGLTTLTRRCKREEEKGRLAKGPIFLVLVGMTGPYLFGTHAAAIGLAQAFVGDAASAFTGMRFGKWKLPFSQTKSWAGTAAFFLAALLVDLVFVPFRPALLLALVGALVESLPIPEGDNLTVPLSVSLAATLFQ